MEAGYKATHGAVRGNLGEECDASRPCYEHMSKFLEDQVLWFRVAESAFDNFMVTGRKGEPAKAAPKK